MRSPWLASAAASRRWALRSAGAISTATPRTAIALMRSFLRANAAAPSRRITSAPSASSSETSVRARPAYASTSACFATSSRYACSAWRSRPPAKSFAAASLARRWSPPTFGVPLRPPWAASACANSPALLPSMTRPAERRARSARGRMCLPSTVLAFTPSAVSSRERKAGAAGPRYSLATPRSSTASAFIYSSPPVPVSSARA